MYQLSVVRKDENADIDLTWYSSFMRDVGQSTMHVKMPTLVNVHFYFSFDRPLLKTQGYFSSHGPSHLD